MIDVMGIGARSITVSTVGVVPGMRRLADEPWQVNLAVSLHAADDELRSRLVPLNDRYPLDDLIAAAAYYFERKGRRVSIEWTMIAGTNDTPEQARKLANIAGSSRRPHQCHLAEPDAAEPRPATQPRRRRDVHRRAAAAGRQRHAPRHAGPGHRCRLRPAPPAGRDRVGVATAIRCDAPPHQETP